MKQILAVIASMIAIGGYVPYMRDAIRKRIQPHPYTWFVWVIVSGITLAGQITKGAGVGALPTAIAEACTLVVFIYALQYGFKAVKKSDTYYLVIALLGLVPWVLTQDPTTSVVIAVSIDFVAFIPTIRKTWVTPTSETPALFVSNVLRHVLTLFSLQSYNIATTLHSAAMIVLNGVMSVIILYKGARKKPVHTN